MSAKDYKAYLYGGGNPDIVDNSSIIIQIEHHKIHDGCHFYSCYHSPTLAANSIAGLYFITPNTASGKQIHMTVDLACSKNGVLRIYEGAGVTATGSAFSIFNNNRISTETSGAKAFIGYDVTISAGATLLAYDIGSDSATPAGISGDVVPRNKELILKQDAEYIFEFEALTANTRATLQLDFYHGEC